MWKLGVGVENSWYDVVSSKLLISQSWKGQPNLSQVFRFYNFNWAQLFVSSCLKKNSEKHNCKQSQLTKVCKICIVTSKSFWWGRVNYDEIYKALEFVSVVRNPQFITSYKFWVFLRKSKLYKILIFANKLFIYMGVFDSEY